jgi:histidyl-tRNA synthetase
MRDFLPAEKRRRDRALGIIRSTYSSHGFTEIETPVVEDIERLHSGLGGDNEKLSYSVLKRGLTPADFAAATASGSARDLADLGLRFDLTVPLARFYASHRAELPATFRSIQIAPVWRAERPQKGRYRQFVQCDIDIIGEPGILAETELLVATLATIEALGLTGSFIRINDRRLLSALLDTFGFPSEAQPGVLITIDKLDKIGPAGVLAELTERGHDESAVRAFHDFLIRPVTLEFLPFGEAAIRKALPAGLESPAIDDLIAIGAGVAAGVGGTELEHPLVFDPFLVRGMGYYTGTIVEMGHPDFESSLGGGGRYDGMIGRFLGTDVPAAGFSIGFERIMDLLELPAEATAESLALVHDDLPVATLIGLKTELTRGGATVRLVRRAKNTARQLDELLAEGIDRFAFVDADATTASALDLRPLV